MKVKVEDKEIEVKDNLLDVLKSELGDKFKKVVGFRVGGEVRDLMVGVGDGVSDVEVIFAGDNDRDALEMLRHSCAHILADAVCKIFGSNVQYTIGPALVDDFKYGFYYDFDLPESISVEDLPKIEKEMIKIAKANHKFERSEVSIEEARRIFSELGQEYKLELIDDIVRTENVDKVSIYRHGDFVDLCRGPHLPNTSFIKAVKLLAVAGAYWRGDANNKMLTRIYGVAFYDKENLNKHIEKIKEAERRDHRVLGKQLDIYSTSELIGQGLIFWHPNGAIIRHIIEEFWLDEHIKRGYKLIYTPHIANEKVYEISGHLEAYSEMMYSPMDIDGQNYRIKPMNCPGHIHIYKGKTRSYRDLPLRYCELGTVYRYEPTGTLHGMLRVRGFTQDDAHIFCTIDQLKAEIEDVIDLIDYMLRTFGYEYKIALATRPEKSIGTDEEWEWSTDALKRVLDERGVEYEVEEGGGVFYGPKIQMMLIDCLGREWQGPTVQVDLNLPRRFECMYVGQDNKEHLVVMVHRAVLGSMERFIGGLIEHYAGAFPVWLAPVQVVVLPVSEKFNIYGENVYNMLREKGFRVEIDKSDDKIGAKIRRATGMKVPYMLVVGQREEKSNQVSVRARKWGELGQMLVDDFIKRLQEDVKTRRLEILKD